MRTDNLFIISLFLISHDYVSGVRKIEHIRSMKLVMLLAPLYRIENNYLKITK